VGSYVTRLPLCLSITVAAAVAEILIKFCVFLQLQLDEFRVYLDYCQNKPNSDKLLQEIGDGNSFFKARAERTYVVYKLRV